MANPVHRITIGYLLLALCGSMTSVAISLHFASQDEGAGLIAAILIASSLAQILLSPLLTPLFDRHSPKTIALAATVCEIGVLLIIVAWPIPAVLIGASLISSALAGISIPALFTITENLNLGSTKAETFALLDTVRLLGGFIGPILAGLLVQLWSLRLAIITEIAANIIVLIVLTTLPGLKAKAQDTTARPRSFLSRLVEAPALLLRNANSRAGLSSIWAAIIFTSIYNVALVFFAVDVLDAGGLGYALVLQAFVVGRIVGARRSRLISPPQALPVLTLCGIIMGISIALTGVVHIVVTSIVFAFIAGVCNALQVGALRLVITSAVPAEVEPKALSSMGSVNTSAMLVGYIIGAPIVSTAGPAMALVLSGVGTALLTALVPVAGWLRSRRGH